MIKTDQRNNREFYYWVIFIYFCIGNKVEIALFNNQDRWEPFITDKPYSFDEIKEKIFLDLGIKKEDCYKDRYVSAGIDPNYPYDLKEKY